MLRRCMNIYRIYEAHTSPALNGGSAIRRFEGDNAIKICGGITFDFHTGLPHMVISRKRQTSLSLESQPPLQINGITMERVDNYKYLGVWITSNLSWNKHITEVCRKARQKVGILSQMLQKCQQCHNAETLSFLY